MSAPHRQHNAKYTLENDLQTEQNSNFFSSHTNTHSALLWHPGPPCGLTSDWNVSSLGHLKQSCENVHVRANFSLLAGHVFFLNMVRKRADLHHRVNKGGCQGLRLLGNANKYCDDSDFSIDKHLVLSPKKKKKKPWQQYSMGRFQNESTHFLLNHSKSALFNPSFYGLKWIPPSFSWMTTRFAKCIQRI